MTDARQRAIEALRVKFGVHLCGCDYEGCEFNRRDVTDTVFEAAGVDQLVELARRVSLGETSEWALADLRAALRAFEGTER